MSVLIFLLLKTSAMIDHDKRAWETKDEKISGEMAFVLRAWLYMWYPGFGVFLRYLASMKFLTDHSTPSPVLCNRQEPPQK